MKASKSTTSAVYHPHAEVLEAREMFAAGDLDPTFGNGGKIISETVGHPVADIAVQADGKYVVVGSQNNDFAITRFNANGTLDRTFGAGGFVRTDFGGAGGDFANSVVVQPDGKIIVAGVRGKPGAHTDSVFALVRLNPNGTPDTSFDTDGKQTIDLGKPCEANAVTLQPDGKILVAGEADTGLVNINDDFGVARLLPNGRLDTTFGNTTLNPFDGNTRTGKATMDFHTDTQGERATAIAVAPDGKIVVGGFGGNDQDFGPMRLAVARLTSDGVYDKTFGDGLSGAGKFNNLLLFPSSIRDLNVAADGSITVAGGINGNFLTVRITSAGRLDTTFNGKGFVETNFGGNDDARSILVNREGILVAGGSSGKFAIARYRLNGTLDQTFSNDGTLTMTVGADDAILTTKLTPDGKLLAYGRSGSVARYFTALPTVNVFSLDPNGGEGGDNAGLIFTRDLRLSFPTRVFYSLGGTATFGTDYTGPQAIAVGEKGGPILQSLPFVDIPAGETTAIVPINVTDDRALESAETAVATIQANAAYSLGNRTTQKIDIADNDTVRVSFQKAGNVHAFAYEPDQGLVFGARTTFGTYDGGLRYGWDVDNTANARDRDPRFAQPGFIYNTFNHLQKPGGGSRWEIAVPNGLYEVKLAAGDPQNTDSVYKLTLEGQLALEGTPANQVRWFERTVRVQVNDGKLTLGNAAGAVNNKVNFIEIKSATPGATPGPVTGNIPVSLPPIAPVKVDLLPKRNVFSELEI